MLGQIPSKSVNFLSPSNSSNNESLGRKKGWKKYSLERFEDPLIDCERFVFLFNLSIDIINPVL